MSFMTRDYQLELNKALGLLNRLSPKGLAYASGGKKQVEVYPDFRLELLRHLRRNLKPQKTSVVFFQQMLAPRFYDLRW